MTNDNVNHRRRRGAWLGLTVLLLALSAAGYALSSSPSAPTRSGTSSAAPAGQVLAPATTQDAAQGGTKASPVVLAPAANNGNGSGGNDNCVEPSSGNGNCAKTFGVTVGQVPALYPSLDRSLPVTFTNPNSFDISVISYQVSVASSASTACPAASLLVPAGTVTLTPGLTAPKKGSVGTTIPIKLPADAPEGCQGVTYTITVNASAVKK